MRAGRLRPGRGAAAKQPESQVCPQARSPGRHRQRAPAHAPSGAPATASSAPASCSAQATPSLGVTVLTCQILQTGSDASCAVHTLGGSRRRLTRAHQSTLQSHAAAVAALGLAPVCHAVAAAEGTAAGPRRRKRVRSGPVHALCTVRRRLLTSKNSTNCAQTDTNREEKAVLTACM
jgi:hypothetical protein